MSRPRRQVRKKANLTKKKAKIAQDAAALAGTTNEALDDGSNKGQAYPAFEPNDNQVIIAKDKLPSLDQDFIKNVKSLTSAQTATIAHTMKDGWDVGSLTKVKSIERPDATGKKKKVAFKFHFKSSKNACWFKLTDREYGASGAFDEQWVVLGKRARAAAAPAEGGAPKKKKKKT